MVIEKINFFVTEEDVFCMRSDGYQRTRNKGVKIRFGGERHEKELFGSFCEKCIQNFFFFALKYRVLWICNGNSEKP